MMVGRTLISVCALLGAAGCDAGSSPGPDEPMASANQEDADANVMQADEHSQLDPHSVKRAQDLARLQSEAERSQMRAQAQSSMDGLRLVVDQSDRKVRIYRGGQLIKTHDVAVGTEKNPTPIGEFAFHRVDLNPRWVPPNSEWAENREPKAPGDPQNPMGRARLVYKMPYTIHGTDNLDSLGKAVSHGSIRLANEHVISLAEILLKAGGSWEGAKWFQQMTQNRDEEYQVPLKQDIPLKIQE
jgi:lipoprotein-anchoring transpeptidase ErfK/SrfK